MEINSISDYRAAIRNGAYAWPGGYPLYFVMSDGEAMSFAAGKKERRCILEALRDYQTNKHERSGWRPVAIEVNWEVPDLYCAHTNERIESAYAEPDTVAPFDATSL